MIRERRWLPFFWWELSTWQLIFSVRPTGGDMGVMTMISCLEGLRKI